MRLRRLPLVKEMVERNSDGASEFFERFNVGDRVAILDAGDIGPNQARPFLNVSLSEILMFPKFAEARADIHERDYCKGS